MHAPVDVSNTNVIQQGVINVHVCVILNVSLVRSTHLHRPSQRWWHVCIHAPVLHMFVCSASEEHEAVKAESVLIRACALLQGCYTLICTLLWACPGTLSAGQRLRKDQPTPASKAKHHVSLHLPELNAARAA